MDKLTGIYGKIKKLESLIREADEKSKDMATKLEVAKAELTIIKKELK